MCLPLTSLQTEAEASTGESSVLMAEGRVVGSLQRHREKSLTT